MTASRRKTILFIDDDEDDYMLMRDIFAECCGVDIRWYKDGEAALKHLFDAGAVLPEVVILDMNMPKMNGREVLERIRGDIRTQHLPVVVLTNSHSQREALDAYRMGVNSFIRKPSGYKELQNFARVFDNYWFQYSVPPVQN